MRWPISGASRREASPSDEFELRFAKRLGLNEASDLIDSMFRGMRPSEPMVAAVRDARAAGIRTGLVSNSWSTSHYDRDLLADLFDAVVISAEVGMHKPQPEIYLLAAERLGRAPSSCVFVDDLRENCAGAEARGDDRDPPSGARRTRSHRWRSCWDSRWSRRPPQVAYDPAAISATPTSAADHTAELDPREALAEHESGEQHRDRRIQGAGDGHEREQPVVRGDGEQRVREDIEEADREQGRKMRGLDPHRGPGERRRPRGASRRPPAALRRSSRWAGRRRRHPAPGRRARIPAPRGRRARPRPAPPRATRGPARGRRAPLRAGPPPPRRPESGPDGRPAPSPPPPEPGRPGRRSSPRR